MAQRIYEAIYLPGNRLVKEQSIELKTSIEVSRIRRACKIVADVLSYIRREIYPGATTRDISEAAEIRLRELEAEPALKGYRGFPGAVCASVNHVAVHGIPGDHDLRDGDIFTVDLTVEKGGWHGDSAWTYIVGQGSVDTRRLLRASRSATVAGILAAKAGGRFGDIGEAVEGVASRYGCSVLDRFVGHGIGREIHEEPMVLHTGEAGTGRPIVPGMVFTIEPILSLGGSEVFALDDGWSMVTSDHSLCAQFEHTIAVFGDRTEVLTWPYPDTPLDGDMPLF